MAGGMSIGETVRHEEFDDERDDGVRAGEGRDFNL